MPRGEKLAAYWVSTEIVTSRSYQLEDDPRFLRRIEKT